MVPIIGDLIKGILVFAAPFVFYMWGMAFLIDFFEKAGIGVLFERYENLMLFGVAVPLLLIGAGLALVAFLQMLGVPLPRFLYPR